MDELKQCPFCGGKAKYEEYWDECDISVQHKKDCWMMEYEGLGDFLLEEKEKAIKAWNTRYEPEFSPYEDEITYMDGQRYATIKRCGNCDCHILIGSNYCHVCGARIKEEDA